MQTEEGEINMEFYENGIFEGTNVDDEFKQQNIKGYRFCKKLTDQLPLDDEDKPIKKLFGKHLFFHKCTLESELKVCIEKEMLKVIEEKHGMPLDLDVAKKLGLPDDKYKVAFVKHLVKMNAMDPTVKTVARFFVHGEGILV